MCTVGMGIYRIISHEYEVNIAAERKPEHCNRGDEEVISPTFVCLEKRQSTPKNSLLLEISLKRFSGPGTRRMVYTPRTFWQLHQRLFAASPFLSRLERGQARQPRPGALPPLRRCAPREGGHGAGSAPAAAWGAPLLCPCWKQGLSLCGINSEGPEVED